MTTSTPSPDLICRVCGTANPAARQFCRRCASDLRAPLADPNAPLEGEPAGPPTRALMIGIGVALAIFLIGTVLVFALGGSPEASPTPQPTSSAAPSIAASAAPTAATSDAPTTAPTDAPEPEPTATAPAASGETGDPVVDTLKGPGRASCTGDNGTGTPGYVHLSWTASNTTGIRLSIDPPAPNNAYDFPYDDYPADGSADVPFTCDPPNSDANGAFHMYVATTIHDGGRFAWRFIRIYIRD